MVQQQTHEVAYVLKRFLPHRHKVGLLTCSLGRVNVIFKHNTQGARLWPGMVLTCTLCRDNGCWITHQVTIHSAPIPQTHQNIIWLHHILELCYYFLPLESPAADVFFYLKKCYCLIWQSEMLDDARQAIIKRICVIKLLSMLGFYAHENIQEYLSLFQWLSDVFVDFTNGQKVEFLKQRLATLNIAEMDEWILNCLKSHPMFSSFKTVSFNY